MSVSLRARAARATTPLIVVGSLVAALGLTALGDSHARAQRPGVPDRSRLLPRADTEMRVLIWTLWNIARYYVEPRRIDPRAMTLRGLEALEASIPEVLVQKNGSGDRVRVRVGTAEQEFDISDVEALWSVGTHIPAVFGFVREHTKLDDERARKVEYAVVAGVLSTLDPHTNLLEPDDFEDMKASTKGSFGGLGIEVGMREGFITVIRVLAENPAAKVDMQPGDQIVRIDEESTVTMTLTEAVSRLRGAPGTTVTVWVMREGLDRPKALAITRETIALPSVTGDVLKRTDPDGTTRKVGLIQIPRNFAQKTGHELREKLAEFEKEGVDGYVLDLRDNPGGLLNAAVEVADAFLSSGTIVSTVGNASSQREENRADDRFQAPERPLVVLVDQGSASASEIVAGALRNLGRAVVVGRRTFGKGSVQVLHDRQSGDEEVALKLTIAQYLTPGDVSIQGVGVSPDVETIPVWITEDNIMFFGRERFDLVREESLAAHLVSEAARPEPSAFGSLYFLDQGSLDRKAEAKAKKSKSEDRRTDVLLDDPEIRMARDLVLWAKTPRRDDLLPQLGGFVEDQRKLEEKRIREALAARSIDWSPGSAAPAGGGTGPRLRVEVRTDKSGNVIRGGESGNLAVSVTNEGNAPAFQVRAITDSDYRYFDERELLFGRIGPGETRNASLRLSVNESELSRTDRIDFHFFEQHGAPLSPSSRTWIDVSGEGLPRPLFSYGYQIVDVPTGRGTVVGNGDGAIQAGERVRLRVRVRNTGEGPALDTWVNLRNLSGEAVYLHSGRERLKEMKTGESREVELDVELKTRPEDGYARFELTVSDNKIAEVLSEKLVFPVRDDAAKVAAVSAGIRTATAVDLYGAPYEGAHVVARTLAGGSYAVTGKVAGWHRVVLPDDSFAFVHADGVGSDAHRPNRSSTVTTVYGVSPPKIALVGAVTQTEQEILHVSGTATDEESVRDIYITVYNPSRNLFAQEEKVFYQAAADPKSGRLPFAADVPLTPGNNLIEIHAREDDDIVATHRMWVLRTSGLTEARKQEAKLTSTGQLSVDTFDNGR